MTPTSVPHWLGQIFWLSTLTDNLLRSSTLAHYIDDLSLTAFAMNPTNMKLAEIIAAARRQLGRYVSGAPV